MTLRHIICCGLTAMLVVMALPSWATPAVVDVSAHQRYPWNGLVDICVTIQGTSNDMDIAEWRFVATNDTTKVAIPVKHITNKGVCSGAGNLWTRSFVWDVKTDAGAMKIDDVALSVDFTIPGVQLWENGPYWAECNVGATKPEEFGYYFWWGDTVGYRRDGNLNRWVSSDGSGISFAFHSGNCLTYDMTNAQLKSAGYIDEMGNLVAAHDAATAHCGAPWRMPTNAELVALISNCTTIWTSRNGVFGRLVTGKGAYASKSIFLPAAGYVTMSFIYDVGKYGCCWSSTPHSGHSDYAWGLNPYTGETEYCKRCLGYSVRPVRESTK